MDDKIPQIQFALSFAYLINRDHGRAIDAARRALELDPGYADALGLLAWIHSFAGQPQEALRVLDQLKRLNPQLNASTLVVLGLAHFLSGDFGEAIQAFQSAREINPEEMTNRLYLAAVLSRSGQEAEAQWEATEIAMLNPELSVDRWIASQPYKDASELSRLRNDLHRAGLPE
jgi:tetratricopeptide (TPR) repeat protein